MLWTWLLLATAVKQPAGGQRDFTLVSDVRLVLLDVGVYAAPPESSSLICGESISGSGITAKSS